MQTEAITAEATLNTETTEAKPSFTISVRSKDPKEPIFHFLRRNFGNIPLEQIESVFGFVERSTLYGGRIFKRPQISERDVYQLNSAGIGLRVPFTNHFASWDEFCQNRPLFRKYHNKLNAVICVNDDLAKWVREYFPQYDIEASVIKNIDCHAKLTPALDIYNTIVLPMPSNYDTEFLSSIDDKSRIRLFANAGCALTCPARICYKSVSHFNKGNGAKDGKMHCTYNIKERELLGMVDFDIDELMEMGFRKFKLLQGRPDNKTGF